MTTIREFLVSEAKAAGWFLFMTAGYTSIAALVVAVVLCLIMGTDHAELDGAFLHEFLSIHKAIWLLMFTVVVMFMPLIVLWNGKK